MCDVSFLFQQVFQFSLKSLGVLIFVYIVLCVGVCKKQLYEQTFVKVCGLDLESSWVGSGPCQDEIEVLTESANK